MQYVMLRLFLTERDIGPLLAPMGDVPTESRQEYLLRVFGQDFSFSGHGISYHYAYIGSIDSYVLGRIGRQRLEQEAKGPETGLEETYERRWHAANILIDTSGHTDGQKIAFQNLGEVGNPTAIADRLIEGINAREQRSKWHIYVNPLTETQEFWGVVEEFKGNITELNLTFVAPNILGGTDKTRDALRKLRDTTHMEETSVRLKNRDGALNPDTDDVREELDYISEGGGRVDMKSRQRTIYTSEERVKTEDLSDEETFAVSEENKKKWPKLLQRLFKRKL